MSKLIPLGAINKHTGEYIYPKIANKKDSYICPDCNKDLTLCQGKIRTHHFRHKVDSVNPCNHYDHPSESQIHKDAKTLLKTLLDKKIPISFNRKCDSCENIEVFEIPETTETSTIQLEHRFEYNGPKIADVAYIDNNELVCIFEICNTHRTCAENRPEPWFEIDAKTLIVLVNDNTSTKLQIPCIRSENCEECVEHYKTHTRSIIFGVNPDKFIYLNAEIANRHLFKQFGGKWSPSYKLWYISKRKYNKNKKDINDVVGKPIIWVGNTIKLIHYGWKTNFNTDSRCMNCLNTGSTYWSDGIWRRCVSCSIFGENSDSGICICGREDCQRGCRV
jgi:uncharacterized protein YkuJ